MKRKTLVILALSGGFAVLVGVALWREFQRDAVQIRHSISGTLDYDSALSAAGVGDIVRTDRVALILVDMNTRQPVAIKFESPLVPPMNFRIGQEDARDGKPLDGRYELVAITDKDGEVFKRVPGEVFGRAERQVALGDEQVQVVLNQPFRGTLFNEAPGAAGVPGAGPAAGDEAGPPERTISGTVRAAASLAGSVAASDRLIVLLFDPELGRPAAVRIVPQARLPQPFSISLPPGQPLKAGYSLRIITDKDGNPFGAAPGEIVGRSAGLVAPGTHGLDFVLDQPYQR